MDRHASFSVTDSGRVRREGFHLARSPRRFQGDPQSYIVYRRHADWSTVLSVSGLHGPCQTKLSPAPATPAPCRRTSRRQQVAPGPPPRGVACSTGARCEVQEYARGDCRGRNRRPPRAYRRCATAASAAGARFGSTGNRRSTPSACLTASLSVRRSAQACDQITGGSSADFATCSEVLA